MLSGVLLVVHVLVSILLILLVLMQSDQSMNLSGMFGGASQSALGSRPQSMLARMTIILGIVFALTSIYFALIGSTEPVFGPAQGQQQAVVIQEVDTPDYGSVIDHS